MKLLARRFTASDAEESAPDEQAPVQARRERIDSRSVAAERRSERWNVEWRNAVPITVASNAIEILSRRIAANATQAGLAGTNAQNSNPLCQFRPRVSHG